MQPNFKPNNNIMKWVETQQRLPGKDGLYLIEHKQHNQSGNRREMFFKTEDQKWYWQPNPYSVCGDGFITQWLDEDFAGKHELEHWKIVEMWEKLSFENDGDKIMTEDLFILAVKELIKNL